MRGRDDHDRQSIVQHRLQHVGRVGCVQRQVGGACDSVTNHRQRYLSWEVKIRISWTRVTRDQVYIEWLITDSFTYHEKWKSGGHVHRLTNHRERYLSWEVKIRRPCTQSDQSQTALLIMRSENTETMYIEWPITDSVTYHKKWKYGDHVHRVTNHRQRYLSWEVKIRRQCTQSDQSQTALLITISQNTETMYREWAITDSFTWCDKLKKEKEKKRLCTDFILL